MMRPNTTPKTTIMRSSAEMLRPQRFCVRYMTSPVMAAPTT